MCIITHMITEQSVANLIRKLATARGWSVTYAARRVSGNGDTVSRIEAGIGLTLRRANQIIAKASDLWPDDAEWPGDLIERPAIQQQGEPSK